MCGGGHISWVCGHIAAWWRMRGIAVWSNGPEWDVRNRYDGLSFVPRKDICGHTLEEEEETLHEDVP